MRIFEILIKRRNILLIAVMILFSFLSGCLNFNNSTAGFCDPEFIYENNNSIDMFVYNNISYVNISEVGWVSDINPEKDELIGTIKRTGITGNFKDWDSTVLETGTNVYTMKNNNDILLIEKEGIIIPYLAYIEG